MSPLISSTSAPLVRPTMLRSVPAFTPALSHPAIRAQHASMLTSATFGCSSFGECERRLSVIAAAKGKGKGGGKGGKKGKGNASSDDDDAPAAKGKKGKGDDAGSADLEQVEKQAKADMADRTKKSLAALADNLNTIRTGRASASILDRVMVDYAGAPTPLKSVAQVSVPDASTLQISPFDPSSIGDIEKAILASDVGITPNNDGQRIRLAIPPLTEDRRKELSKLVSKYAEDGKVALRNVRTDILKKTVNKADFSKDAKKDLENDIQTALDAAVKKVEELAKAKTDEVMKL